MNKTNGWMEQNAVKDSEEANDRNPLHTYTNIHIA